jgi:hypothetical protein
VDLLPVAFADRDRARDGEALGEGGEQLVDVLPLARRQRAELRLVSDLHAPGRVRRLSGCASVHFAFCALSGMFQWMIAVRRTPTSSIAVVRWRPFM